MARDPSRRMILRQLGASAIVTPLAYTLGCSGDDAGSGTRGGTEGTEGTATSGATDTTGESSGGLTESSSDSSSGELCGGAAEDWAAGGTAAMTDKDCYPDPFAAGLAGCALLCRTTAGPCTAETTVRQDVSEGWPGLPVRLALKIVRAETCEVVEGAVHPRALDVEQGVARGEFGDDVQLRESFGVAAGVGASVRRADHSRDHSHAPADAERERHQAEQPRGGMPPRRTTQEFDEPR